VRAEGLFFSPLIGVRSPKSCLRARQESGLLASAYSPRSCHSRIFFTSFCGRPSLHCKWALLLTAYPGAQPPFTRCFHSSNFQWTKDVYLVLLSPRPNHSAKGSIWSRSARGRKQLSDLFNSFPMPSKSYKPFAHSIVNAFVWPTRQTSLDGLPSRKPM
jgi:hypothetical protein